MEEWVGERWHRLIWRAADPSYRDAAVSLEEVTRAVQMLFRAGGGDPLIRVVPATEQKIGGPRGWLQKLAGQGERAALSTLDEESLALPPVIAVFPDRLLNRDLYLWLAAQGACLTDDTADWVEQNLNATRRALDRFPGLQQRYARLVQAHLAQRPRPAELRKETRDLEQTIQDGLRASLNAENSGESDNTVRASAPSPNPTAGSQPPTVAPVWLWLQPHVSPRAQGTSEPADSDDPAAQNPRGPDEKSIQQDPKRRRAQRTEDSSSKDGMMMFFRAESFFSWSEFVRVNRTGDDEDNQDHSQVADDLEELHLAHRKPGETLAARIKFDLDLPSASADDLPAGEGEPLPEWDYKRGVLLADHCRVQRLRARDPVQESLAGTASGSLPARAGQGQGGAPPPSTELQRTARQVRRRFEALRAAPRWQHGLTQGEELNLDDWVRFQVDRRSGHDLHQESPAIFSRRERSQRSLATAILAALSLSTDAYATPQARVIDLVRDSLFVFGDALQGAGDPFEMLGFSSVRRNIRIHEIKRFAEPWDHHARERVAAIKPGFYTRLGAAIRHTARRLSERGERQRLLLILSDGKPNDLDHYEGRHGLEDTRHAVHEARQLGLVPFCVTIDQTANAYLPRLFGTQGYALVHRPEQLARALTQVYVRLTVAAR